MRSKRGQLTLFIIIAIVVVALGITTWLLWPRISGIFMTEAQAQSYLAEQGAQLQEAVHYCVSTVSDEIIREQGLHAGYYSYSHLYALDFAGPKLVVMYKDANKFRLNELPSLSAMESEFGRALELEGYAKIDSCLNNFEPFKKKMIVEPGERRITADIEEENVIIKVEWPITIRKARASATLEQKDIELLIPLGRVWIVANDIINNEVNQTNFIWQIESYIRANDNLMRYTRLEMQNYPTSDQTVYMIRTVPYRPKEIEYLFNFAVDRA